MSRLPHVPTLGNFDCARRRLEISRNPKYATEEISRSRRLSGVRGFAYRVQGTVACEILDRYRDENGQECVRVTTARPWSRASNEGLAEFTVPASLVTSNPNRRITVQARIKEFSMSGNAIARASSGSFA